MHRCKDCGGEVVPYSHPVAPETFPPFVCAKCGRFYMRSELADLATDAGPQEGAHSPVDVSWYEWEPGHEGKAIVTDNGHVYTWSNGQPNPEPKLGQPYYLSRPNGKYMSHPDFMRQRLSLPKLPRDWHYFELDPDGTAVPDSNEDHPGHPEAVEQLEQYHPMLRVPKGGSRWYFG